MLTEPTIESAALIAAISFVLGVIFRSTFSSSKPVNDFRGFKDNPLIDSESLLDDKKEDHHEEKVNDYYDEIKNEFTLCSDHIVNKWIGENEMENKINRVLLEVCRKGVLFKFDSMMLQELGVPVIEIIVEHTGYSKKRVLKEIDNYKIGYKLVMNAYKNSTYYYLKSKESETIKTGKLFTIDNIDRRHLSDTQD